MLKDNSLGHVDFVDAAYSQYENTDHKKIQRGFLEKVDPKEHFAKIKVDQYIDTHIMTKYAIPKRNINIFISMAIIMKGKLDYKLFWPKLTKMVLCFHDVVAQISDKGLRSWKFEIKK